MLPQRPLNRVGILAVDSVFASTLLQAQDFFHMASLRFGKRQGLGLTPTFQTVLLSPDGQPVHSFSGTQIPVDGALQPCDLIILPSFAEEITHCLERHRQVLPWLQECYQAGSVLCAQASGVFWLAEAGLLDGLEATTYWRFQPLFTARYPKVQLKPDQHLVDAGRLLSAAGVSSASDLYLQLIEHFCGASTAQDVARDSLHEVQRSYTPGRIGFGGQKLHHDGAILLIQQWLEEHFAERFRFEDVARQHGMSIRNFMRRFQAATGDKPLHYLQRLRIETAKSLLCTSNKSIKTISYEVGYDDASFFARLFRQHTDCSPLQYRQRFKASN